VDENKNGPYIHGFIDLVTSSKSSLYIKPSSNSAVFLQHSRFMPISFPLLSPILLPRHGQLAHPNAPTPQIIPQLKFRVLGDLGALSPPMVRMALTLLDLLLNARPPAYCSSVRGGRRQAGAAACYRGGCLQVERGCWYWSGGMI